jgi:hypothetical protein
MSNRTECEVDPPLVLEVEDTPPSKSKNRRCRPTT